MLRSANADATALDTAATPRMRQRRRLRPRGSSRRTSEALSLAVPLPAVPLSSSSFGTYDAPDDLTRERRLDWAALLKRTHLIDVLVCPKCAGPMRLIAFVQDERVARRILEHLGLWPPRAPPRSERPSRSGESVWVRDLDAIDPQFPD